MVVMILEKVSPGLRGELTRWLLEPRTGVFVGKVSALVRDKLWQKVREALKTGAAILVHDSDSEQGFLIHTAGPTGRKIQDFEGLFLVKKPRKG